MQCKGSHPHGFIVMLTDGHLEVQPCELAQMSVSVAVLCSEHGSDLKYPGVSSCKGEEVEVEKKEEEGISIKKSRAKQNIKEQRAAQCRTVLWRLRL